MTIMSSNSPGWESPQAFCRHVAHYLSLGWEPCPPSTVEELNAALECWPEYARRWLPSEAECLLAGIDRSIGLPVEPLSEREQERLLVTLRDDLEFRLAVRAILLGGTAQ